MDVSSQFSPIHRTYDYAFRYRFMLRNALTSWRNGLAIEVPLRVTERAAEAAAILHASYMDLSSASATANAPLKASPAPVVSTASTSKAGTWKVSFWLTAKTPPLPSVTRTVRAPRSRSTLAALSAESRSTTSIPLIMLASLSFGVRTST